MHLSISCTESRNNNLLPYKFCYYTVFKLYKKQQFYQKNVAIVSELWPSASG